MRHRGERGDDALHALHASLGTLQPEYHGTHYDFEGFVVDPPATCTDGPLWIGGRGYRSLRRAEPADGWAPFGVRVEQTDPVSGPGPGHRGVDRPRALVGDRPLPRPGRHPAMIDRYVEAGATILNLRLRARSLEQCL